MDFGENMGYVPKRQKKLYVYNFELNRIHRLNFRLCLSFNVNSSIFFTQCQTSRMGSFVLYLLFHNFNTLLGCVYFILVMVSF